MNSKTAYKLTYGLFVLTARENGKDNGCIINTAQQVTTTPNRITIAVNKANYTHDMIKNTKKFNISILSEDAEFDLFKRFGFQSGREADKFADFSGMKRSENGLYYVTEGTNGYISATVEYYLELDTHTLFIATVDDMEVLSEVPSATYGYYQSNIKSKPQPKPETETGKKVFRCTVCGYEYEGDSLPEDFICPLCKHPASDFEEVKNS